MKLPLRFALFLWAPIAFAQSNLGELLDVGATKLSAETFKEEIVQRIIVGPSLSGAYFEVMYASNGTIQGRGSLFDADSVKQPMMPQSISGEWRIDDNGRICTSMRIGMGVAGSGGNGGPLPPRCQFWFKHGDEYFFSDSDSDRHARVLRRTLKQ